MTHSCDSALADLRAKGFALITGVLTDAEVDRVAGAIDPLIDATPVGRVAFEGFNTKRVYNLAGKTAATDGLIAHPAILDLVHGILGEHIQLSIALAIAIGPGEVAQALHRDDSLFPVPWERRPVVVNTMWAIDDFTLENGATRVAPGSHLVESPPAGAVSGGSPDGIISAVMRRGSVLVWLGTLVHGGGANLTDRVRRGVAVNYTPSWLRQQENYYLGLSEERVAAMPEVLQRLCGWSYHPPFIGFVDGRDPIKRVRHG